MRTVLMMFILNLIATPAFSQGVAGAPPNPEMTPVRVPISREEKAKIYADFKRKLAEEEKQFENQEKNKRRDLVRMQNDRRREWEANEKRSRRAYFEKHTSGPERRAYVQDFVKRKKEFDANEKREWSDFKRKQKEERKVFRISEQERTQKVNAALEQNIRPEI